MQHIALLGSSEADEGVDPPAPLADLCPLYSLPPPPAGPPPDLAARVAADHGPPSHTPPDAALLQNAGAAHPAGWRSLLAGVQRLRAGLL